MAKNSHSLSYFWSFLTCFFQIFCCQWHSYAHFGSLFNLNIPDPCGVKVSSHFWANEPYIYGWWGLKMGLFYGKNSPKWRVGSRAEKPPWKLANGPKHTPSNRERCFGHFYAPSRYHSRSRWVSLPCNQPAIWGYFCHKNSAFLRSHSHG